jgi:carbohydrate-selective porin OprB
MNDLRTGARAIRRAVAVVAAMALVIAAVAATMAFAHNKVFPSQVTFTKAVGLNPVKARFKGRVLAGKAPCKTGREVQVYDISVNPDRRLAKAFSNANGRWVVTGHRPPNGHQLYAIMETKVLPGGAGHNHSCQNDTSPTLVFPHP